MKIQEDFWENCRSQLKIARTQSINLPDFLHRATGIQNAYAIAFKSDRLRNTDLAEQFKSFYHKDKVTSFEVSSKACDDR